MRAVARRLARLEEVLGPRTRHATLKDLILASMGEPLPEGVVWGGPLAEAFAALPAPEEDERPRSAHDAPASAGGLRGSQG